MTSTRILSLLVLASLAGASAAAQSKVGTTIGEFLLIEPSARITGMGNAGVTNYDEIQSAYYNPAAIGHFQGTGLQVTHAAWIADIAYDFAALGMSFGDLGNFYASVTSLNSGDIDVTTIQQEHGTGEKYSVTDVAVTAGYGREISERFSVGMTVSYVQETIWHSSLKTVAFGIGTIYRISPNGLHIGASLSNFGTQAGYDGTDLRVSYDQNTKVSGDNPNIPAAIRTDQFSLPGLLRVGVGLPVKIGEDNLLHVEVDAFHPSDNTESISTGAEWSFRKTFFLRAGYQNLFLKDSEVGLTLGAGIQYDMPTFTFSLDYGWADQGRLTQSHRFTLGVAF